MKRTEKEQLVAELKDKIKNAPALYYTDFTGLNVKRMTELRRRMRKANIEYVVIKNTLALRAVNESGLVADRLRGPTGLVVTRDPITAAKLLQDFAKENDQKPTVKGGMLEGKAIAVAQVKQLLRCPRAIRCSRSWVEACSLRCPPLSARSTGCCTCSLERSTRCTSSAAAPPLNPQATSLT